MAGLDDFLAGVRSIGETGEAVAQSYRTVLNRVNSDTVVVTPVPGFTPQTQQQANVATIAPGEELGFQMPSWGWWVLGGLGLSGLGLGLYLALKD